MVKIMIQLSEIASHWTVSHQWSVKTVFECTVFFLNYRLYYIAFERMVTGSGGLLSCVGGGSGGGGKRKRKFTNTPTQFIESYV